LLYWNLFATAFDYTRITLVAEKSNFNESDGNISDALFIQLDREMESSVSIYLSQTKGKLNFSDL